MRIIIKLVMIIIIIYNSRILFIFKEKTMIGIGEKLPEFKLVSVKPGFNDPEESGESAFEEFSDSFWIYPLREIYVLHYHQYFLLIYFF